MEGPRRDGNAAVSLPGERTVLLAGTRLGTWASSDELAEMLRWHFGRLPAAEGQPELRVLVDEHVPSRPATPATMLDGPITRWEGDGADLVLRHELGSGARLEDDTLHVGLTGPREGRWRALRQLLFSALSWFLEQRGLLVLHGAMVSRPGGAVVLVGPTGAGKSTACVAALLGGWELHSDDLVVVRTGPRGPICSGVPKRPSVDPALAARLDPALVGSGDDLPADPRGRRMLTADALSVADRPLAAVVVVGHDDGAGRLESLSGHESISALVLACLEVSRDGVLGRHLGLFAALAARPAFRLSHAIDAGVRVERAGAMLQAAWDAATERTPRPLHDHPQ